MNFVLVQQGCIFGYHTTIVSRHKALIVNPLLLTTPTLYPFAGQDIGLAAC
jgi:hypothetical protein